MLGSQVGLGTNLTAALEQLRDLCATHFPWAVVSFLFSKEIETYITHEAVCNN